MMARNVRYGGQYGLSGESEKIILGEIKRSMSFIRPFLLWPVVIIFMVVIRLMWPASIPVVAFLAAAGICLALFVFYHTHERKIMGVLHGPVSVLLLMSLLGYADMAGNTTAVQFLAIIVLPMFLLTWAIRGGIRQKDSDGTDNLNEIFEKAGIGGARLHWKPPTPGQLIKSLKGIVRMPRGEKSPDDLVKKAVLVEGGLGIPPQSLTVVPNEDRADWADVTLSDPRVLRKPIDWPGPSFGGESIAKPIRVGKWQDDAPVNWPVTDQHVQIMGMTGSGKSLGAGWSTLAELITRNDVAIFAADITKGNQTLGPFKDSLYRLETTKNGARNMLLDISATVKPRTDYLASQGLAKWQEGCGLSYIVVWLEEAPDIIDNLGDAGQAKWISSLKAARSAGISFFISLQRSDWTQLPTIARGQLSKWCFGVAESTDAAFGLSDQQLNRDATPELWGMRHPGMAYLDAPGIAEERVAMPMRTWYFGNTDAKVRLHAMDYPQSAKPPLDQITADAIQRNDIPRDVTEPDGSITEPEDEPGFDYTDNGSDLEKASPELTAKRFAADPMPLAVANPHEALRDFIIDSKMSAVSVADLMPFSRSIGLKRTWLYRAMDMLAESGLVERDETRDVTTWLILGRDDTFNLERARAFIASGKDRAEEYGAPVDPGLTPESMLPLYEATHCYLCEVAIGAKRQIDHRVPLSKGGAHALANLGAACVFCNESKGDDTEQEYRARMEAA
jgi:hypothetical protein